MTDEVEQLRGAHPGQHIELVATGDTRGRWDGARLQQLLRNLVSNAIKYGSPHTPVRVALRGEGADVHLEVTNSGPPIDPSALSGIFDPLTRGSAPTDTHHVPEGLGLGLFIVREIATAHGGAVGVRSDGETTLALRLPRHSRSEAP